mmetsp:Transcript_128894/g.360616  ORF Transcript_128894/g.360616 Transcript_128894/m.360616 type:complete len:291 (+) Transcript_128894:1011-1883(+)
MDEQGEHRLHEKGEALVVRVDHTLVASDAVGRDTIREVAARARLACWRLPLLEESAPGLRFASGPAGDGGLPAMLLLLVPPHEAAPGGATGLHEVPHALLVLQRLVEVHAVVACGLLRHLRHAHAEEAVQCDLPIAGRNVPRRTQAPHDSVCQVSLWRVLSRGRRRGRRLRRRPRGDRRGLGRGRGRGRLRGRLRRLLRRLPRRRLRRRRRAVEARDDLVPQHVARIAAPCLHALLVVLLEQRHGRRAVQAQRDEHHPQEDRGLPRVRLSILRPLLLLQVDGSSDPGIGE